MVVIDNAYTDHIHKSKDGIWPVNRQYYFPVIEALMPPEESKELNRHIENIFLFKIFFREYFEYFPDTRFCLAFRNFPGKIAAL